MWNLNISKWSYNILTRPSWGGWGGGVQMSLVWKSVWLFSILKSRTCPCQSFFNSSLCCFSTFHLVSFCCRLSKSPLLFFSGWLCHFKGPFIPVSFSSHWSKILWVRPHDNWLIGQWVIFHTTPDTAHVNPFFPKWIYNQYDSNPFRRNKSTLRLCHSLGRCKTSCIKAQFAHF